MRNKDYDYCGRFDVKTVLAKLDGLFSEINGEGDCSHKGSEVDFFCLNGAIDD